MTRTPEEIYQDIASAMAYGHERIAEMGGDEWRRFLDGDEWRRFRAEKTERVHALWTELAEATRPDRDVPAWASLAVALVRDQYRRELEDVTAGTT